MKIIRTIESFYPYVSGPANQAFKISDELEKRGISSPIFTTDYMAKKSKRNEKIGNVDVFRFRSNMRFMKYIISKDFKWAIKRAYYNIMHSHNYRSYETAVAYKYARKQGRPFVINTHGSLLGYDVYLKGLKKLPYVLYDLLSSKKPVLNADKVIVSSDIEIKEALDFGVSENKIEKIPMGINVDEYDIAKKNNKKFTLLFVGRISRNRKLETIINALKLIDNARLIVVGNEAKNSMLSKKGYLDELRILAKKIGVDNRIIWAGAKYGKDLRDYYAMADVFVYSSLSENFGQPLLEAAASGLPIVSTKVGIANEIIADNKTGFLYAFNDHEELAEKLELLRDYKKRVLFGDNIRKIVIKKFDWDNIINRYEDIYVKLIE